MVAHGLPNQCLGSCGLRVGWPFPVPLVDNLDSVWGTRGLEPQTFGGSTLGLRDTYGGDVWGRRLGVISRPLHSKTSLKNMFLDWNMRFRVAALSTFGGHHSKTSLENISQKHLSKTSLKKTSLKNISQKHLSKTSLKNISQKHLSKTSLSNISQKHLSTTSLHPEKTPPPHSFSDPRDPMGHMFPYGHIHPRGHMRQKAYVPIRQPSDIYSERKTIFPHPFKN